MLKVLKSGLYTSIQDTGRFGYRSLGVPVSGAMDAYSSTYANTILGNSIDDAVLEITMSGPQLQFLKPTQIAIAGADLQPRLNGRAVQNNRAIMVTEEDVLTFSGLNSGLRTYLAVKGGFITKTVLESKSMYRAITDSERIQAGEIIEYTEFAKASQTTNAHIKYDSTILSSKVLEVSKGPEFERLNEVQVKRLEKQRFEVSKFNNRMAYQLLPILPNDLNPIITTPILPGTVQLTPSGHLIVLMRDCQTTGGYPRILQLTERSINILCQKRQGEEIILRIKD
ncbi:5-oxoprolinase subunit C family protein [Winogradskyella alexanderae]|uniref:Biotin-dependent carboxyltransferase family protein n=1 Tax=Winogradskyella alexanderae TaxID=2877123 RepID=A0ABS7XT30_9FLAO|nr:biotin-dependent carboxyltransferase family protein [Winogradskyella alexanderae]MCA0133182.1 biotin-dependent carboxyltransferase family protein [Winogradskyella alexanderae]